MLCTNYVTISAQITEHKYVLDTDKLNRETNERDRNLYDALEGSKWQHIEPLEIF